MAGRLPASPGTFRLYAEDDYRIPFASGSNPPDAVVIAPCSMGMLGRIAAGVSSSVLERCADVTLRQLAIDYDPLPFTQGTIVALDPGRGTLDLRGIEIVILDEADRLLDMGFAPDVRRLLRRLPDRRQTALFSATLSWEVRDLASRFMRDPTRGGV